MNWTIWALLSAFFAGLTAVLAKVGVAEINSNLATSIRTSVILLFTWLVVLLTVPPKSITMISWRTWQFLIGSGLATALSWLCYFRALQMGPASRVAPVDKLSVVFAILLSAFFLGEPLGWQHWVGGTLVVLGAITLAL